MNLLTAEQRKNAIACLATAPDDVILSAMVDFKAHMHRMEGIKRNFNDTIDELNGVLPERRGATTVVEEVAPILDEPTVERKNVSPGTPLIGKIGTRAREELLQAVKDGTVFTDKQLTMFKEHLKLLWSRKEVKFDGQVYYA